MQSAQRKGAKTQRRKDSAHVILDASALTPRTEYTGGGWVSLDGNKVQYLIVGGLAVNAHGFVRLTRDLDLVLSLKKKNVLGGLRALLNLGYHLAIPAKPEDFADATIRERWRVERNMIVLKLWSDAHQRTPVDIFVYEPFDFASEARRAAELEIYPGLSAKVVTLKTLLQMKRAAGRPQDLIDIEELERLP